MTLEVLNPVLAITGEELTNAAIPSRTHQCVQYRSGRNGPSDRQLQFDRVIRRVREILLRPEVALGRLDRRVRVAVGSSVPRRGIQQRLRP